MIGDKIIVDAVVHPYEILGTFVKHCGTALTPCA